MRVPIKLQTEKIKEIPSVRAEVKEVLAGPWTIISKLAIYLLVFLLPLWFLPWTVNILDFQKQALLIFLVFLSLFGFLLKSLVGGKINLNLNIFNLALVVFLLVLAASTFFSDWRYGSFWGWPLNIASSFLTVLGFSLFYFLVVNTFKEKGIQWLLSIFIFSTFLTILFGVLQTFGKFALPFDFSKVSSFNTIGTVNALGIFIACLLPLMLSLIFISRGLIKILLFFVGFLGLFLLFIINFWVAWLSLLAGSALILIFGIARREIFHSRWLSLSIVLLIISLFFGVMRISLPGLPATPLEISPSQRATFDIASQTLKNSPASFLLGSGPATFVYDYSKFKSAALNQTAFWGVRFSNGASEISDKLMTTGILGLLSFFGILGAFGFFGFKELVSKAKKEKPRWVLSLGIFASWLALVVSQFLYPVNLSLGFLFWFFIAGFVSLAESREKSWTLQPSSTRTLVASFAFIFILIFGTGLLFLVGQRYLAEVRYFQGLSVFQRGDNQAAVNHILGAISQTGGKQDVYWRDLSQLYLFRITEELQKPGVRQEERGQIITPLVANLVNSAKAATDAAPKNVANWAARGFVYRQIINLVEGVEEWAIRSYEEALKLEPTNPYLYTELGLVYLARGEGGKAGEEFQKAIDLKSDYAPAHFQMAMVNIQEGKIAEALRKMEEAKRLAPLDVGLAFQLGVLYYNDKQFGKAKLELERTVALDPNYSNARYFLGLVYDREGKKELAVFQFEKIAELNPDNEEVKKILANLRGGKAALEGVVPSQPPIEEKPPERLEK